MGSRKNLDDKKSFKRERALIYINQKITLTLYKLNNFQLYSTIQFNLKFNIYLILIFRPPGIYKVDYLQELYKRYEEALMHQVIAPELPSWHTGK